LLLCLLSPLACLAASGPAKAAAPREFTAVRNFSGAVRLDMAAPAAKLAAELAALDQAIKRLADNPDLLFAAGAPPSLPPGESPPSPPAKKARPLSVTANPLSRPLSSPLPRADNKARPEKNPAPEPRTSAHVRQEPLPALDIPLDGLAKTLYSVRVRQVGLEGFPPAVQARAVVELIPPKDMRAALQAALGDFDLVEINDQAQRYRRRLLDRYDTLAAELLPGKTAPEGTALPASLENVVDAMRAMDMFLELLPDFDGRWSHPGTSRAAVERALRLAPDNPLLLVALAEIMLQLNRPGQALTLSTEALEAAPDYARAHNARGTALLARHLPALAVEAFGKAIALSPRNKNYYLHRASASMALLDEAGMCGDFTRACVMGDCQALEWAKGIGKCR
jgi:tetratricopeptide (TPR) repeat protein